jgi:uncharacterized protein (TIGR02265 family)
VKGFYLRAFEIELASQGHPVATPGSYRDFGDYPLSLAAEILLDGASRLYPDEPRQVGLRRMGWIVYPTLLSTMVGRVVFGSLGSDLQAALSRASRGFEISISQGSCTVLQLAERKARLAVRSFPLHADSFVPGIFEGALAHYGHAEGRVESTLLSPMDVDLQLTW